MFINATGYYVPEERVDNQHFLELNGLTSEWIEQRTGIRTRSKAKEEENINTMSMDAVRNALPRLPYDISEVDLIISASYSPYDTVATAAHQAQHDFNITEAKALYLSSACSSFLNALEVVEGYFAMGKASKALILSADKTGRFPSVTVDLGREREFLGIAYTPAEGGRGGCMMEYRLEVGPDGESWTTVTDGAQVDNIVNNPTMRILRHKSMLNARWIRVSPLRSNLAETVSVGELSLVVK